MDQAVNGGGGHNKNRCFFLKKRDAESSGTEKYAKIFCGLFAYPLGIIFARRSRYIGISVVRPLIKPLFMCVLLPCSARTVWFDIIVRQ